VSERARELLSKLRARLRPPLAERPSTRVSGDLPLRLVPGMHASSA